jgi:tetratricopeptide (TPR) repeat protein
MRSAKVLVLLATAFLIGCASSSPDAQFQADATTCNALSATECQSFLNKKGVTGRGQSEILMSIALTELSESAPDTDKAISFLTEIVKRDPSYALAHQNLGAALLLSAQDFRAKGNTLRTLGDSMGALIHSQRAIELDPNQETPYTLSVAAAGLLGDCISAHGFQQLHLAKFGDNAQQEAMRKLMIKMCSSFSS